MKTQKKIFLGFLFSIFFFSCSKDEIDANETLYGVWENTKIDNIGDKITFSLVFAPEGVVGEIYRVEDEQGRITSKAEGGSWDNINNIIKVIDSQNESETYYINGENQLVSNESDDLILKKVSNDYSRLGL